MLDAQLLVMHCGGLNHRQSDQLLRHGATWVTDFADQHMLLQYADVLVTHGDLDIVLEAVVAETPILALPIAADQPGVAARVAYSGSGVHASRHSSSQELAQHMRHLLENQWPELEHLADAIHLMGGTQRAADIIEAVIPDRFKLRLVSSG
jgi:zeaxanthin glucosyltransferase